LNDDDAEVVAVLDHQETLSVRRDVVALVSHEIERVGTVEKLDRLSDSEARFVGDGSRQHLATFAEEKLSTVRGPDR
jgi:hypothetical protein